MGSDPALRRFRFLFPLYTQTTLTPLVLLITELDQRSAKLSVVRGATDCQKRKMYFEKFVILIPARLSSPTGPFKGRI